MCSLLQTLMLKMYGVHGGDDGTWFKYDYQYTISSTGTFVEPICCIMKDNSIGDLKVAFLRVPGPIIVRGFWV